MKFKEQKKTLPVLPVLSFYSTFSFWISLPEVSLYISKSFFLPKSVPPYHLATRSMQLLYSASCNAFNRCLLAPCHRSDVVSLNFPLFQPRNMHTPDASGGFPSGLLPLSRSQAWPPHTLGTT